EAYLGLYDFAKARQNYENALIYFHDYQPAIDGLAKLEAAQFAIRKTDTTGPEIEILEPTTMRGLIVVVINNTVMVRGLAKDSSGLKEVLINGVAVYFQEDGNFWGSVTL